MESSVAADWTSIGFQPYGEKIPYQWRGTTGWSWEIALDSLLGARQISTLGDLRAAVSIQALGTICCLWKT